MLTAVTAVKAVALLVVAYVVTIAVAAGSGVTDPHPTADRGSPIAWQDDPLQRLMTDHRCSSTGFGRDAIPGSALIRRDGEVLHVDFDHGWEVFTGEREGTLIAVCLDDR